MKWTSAFLLMFLCIYVSAQELERADKHAHTVAFTTDYASAARELAGAFDQDILKVRALFKWITLHIQYDEARLNTVLETGQRERHEFTASSAEGLAAQKKEMIETFIETTLREKKGVCQDYAYLFQAMCSEVGLEAEFIRGFGRFSASSIGELPARANHAWNAVKIDGRWRLFDVTWSTGMGMEGGDYGDGFFMVDPEIFIMTHYPDDSRWQLLESPIDKKSFAFLPFMHASYLKYNVLDFKPTRERVTEDAVIELKIELEEGQRLCVLKGGKLRSERFEERSDDRYQLALTDTTLEGNIMVGLIDGKRIMPLVSIRVLDMK